MIVPTHTLVPAQRTSHARPGGQLTGAVVTRLIRMVQVTPAEPQPPLQAAGHGGTLGRASPAGESAASALPPSGARQLLRTAGRCD